MRSEQEETTEESKCLEEGPASNCLPSTSSNGQGPFATFQNVFLVFAVLLASSNSAILECMFQG